MKTTIDNNCAVYQVHTTTGKSAVCNLNDLNQVCEKLGAVNGYFKVHRIDNNKLVRVYDTKISDFFKYNKIGEWQRRQG